MELHKAVKVRLRRCSTPSPNGGWQLELWLSGGNPFAFIISIDNDTFSKLLAGRDCDLAVKCLCSAEPPAVQGG